MACRFEIAVPSPFRLDLTVWALRRRSHNQMDRLDAGCWRRVLLSAGRPVEGAVTQPAGPGRPRLAVEATARGRVRGGALEAELRDVVGRCLGLDVNQEGFYHLAGGDRRLRRLVGRFYGMRPPRFPTVFEAVVNAIACQQLSLTMEAIWVSAEMRAGGAYRPLHGSVAHPGRPSTGPLKAANRTSAAGRVGEPGGFTSGA